MAEEQVVRIVQWPSEQRAQLFHGFDSERPASVKLCVSVCEPICAQSEYTIGIEIFDRPVASITVRGTTRLFNCSDKPVIG
jgi:hypothetical protein